MRIWVLSDLHLEAAPLDPPLEVPDADVCVVAGDLCRGVSKGVAFLADLLKGKMPAVYVAGNHEYWKSSIEHEIEQGRQAFLTDSNIHFLEDDAVVLGGVSFIGATLWTDFQLRGSPGLAIRHARECMNDYRRIALRKEPWERFSPHDGARIHARSKAYIQRRLADCEGRSVVVTHHAPTPLSIPQLHAEDPVSPAYASDLLGRIEGRAPDLWVHGHVHETLDFQVGVTRVLCNPRGYGDENPSFQPGLVLEI